MQKLGFNEGFASLSHSHKVKMAVKLRTEYGSVLHMPTLKENLREKGGPNSGDPYGHKQYSGNQG